MSEKVPARLNPSVEPASAWPGWHLAGQAPTGPALEFAAVMRRKRFSAHRSSCGAASCGDPGSSLTPTRIGRPSRGSRDPPLGIPVGGWPARRASQSSRSRSSASRGRWRPASAVGRRVERGDRRQSVSHHPATGARGSPGQIRVGGSGCRAVVSHPVEPSKTPGQSLRGVDYRLQLASQPGSRWQGCVTVRNAKPLARHGNCADWHNSSVDSQGKNPRLRTARSGLAKCAQG